MAEVEYIKKFATKVRVRRYEVGLTQIELAELVGCHPNQIGLVERGKVDPSLSMIMRIARALKVDHKALMP